MSGLPNGHSSRLSANGTGKHILDQEVWELPEPISMATEKAVLSAMIFDGYDDDRLQSHHFGNPDHRNCFEAISHIRYVRGAKVTPYDVAAVLDKKDQLASFGGVNAFWLLEQDCPDESSYSWNVKQLCEYAERRSQRALGRRIFIESSLPHYDLADIRDLAAKAAETPDFESDSLLTAGELFAKYPDERPAVIGGLLREAEFGTLVSSSKGGKTFTIHGLAVDASLGWNWLGRFPIAACDVAIVDNELHLETLSARLQTVCRAKGLEHSLLHDRLRLLGLRGQWLDLDRVLTRLRRLKHRPRLVLIDSLYRMLPAGISENDNSALTQIFNALDYTAQKLESSILVVHHASKGSQTEKSVTDVGSGAGAMSRAVDVHLVMRPHEEPGCVVLDGRLRSFPPIQPVVLRWEYPLWVVDETFDPGRLRGGASSGGAAKQLERDREADADVLDSADTWISKTELMRRTELGGTRAQKAIDRCRAAGSLQMKRMNVSGNDCDVYRRTDCADGGQTPRD